MDRTRAKERLGQIVDGAALALMAAALVYVLYVDRAIVSCLEISFLSQGILLAAAAASILLLSLKFLFNMAGTKGTKVAWFMIIATVVFALFLFDDYGYGGPECGADQQQSGS